MGTITVQAQNITTDRAELLADMPAENVQEYMHNHGFTFEEVSAELSRRAQQDSTPAQVEDGNITAGQPVSKMLAAGTLEAGTVGYFYGQVEPQCDRRLAIITGHYQHNGKLHVTFRPVSGGREFTAAPAAKFATYTNQQDARRMFDTRAAQYRAAMARKDWIACTALEYV